MAVGLCAVASDRRVPTLRGVGGLAAAAPSDCGTPAPPLAVGLCAVASDRRVPTLRGAGGLAAAAPLDCGTPAPPVAVGLCAVAATGVRLCLDMLVLALRGVDGMPALAPRDRDTPALLEATGAPALCTDMPVIAHCGVDVIPALAPRERGTLKPGLLKRPATGHHSHHADGVRHRPPRRLCAAHRTPDFMMGRRRSTACRGAGVSRDNRAATKFPLDAVPLDVKLR